MIVDFQHHFTPRDLIRDGSGDRLVRHYDENGGAESLIRHHRKDEHIMNT
jgi:hypothetical protein